MNSLCFNQILAPLLGICLAIPDSTHNSKDCCSRKAVYSKVAGWAVFVILRFSDNLCL